MIKKTILFIMFLLALPLHAEVHPQSAGYDKRIVVVDYNPDDVVHVHVAIGTGTLIQLERGENIQASDAGMGMGDTEAWGLDIKGNNIFLKPIAKQPDTNLTVVTNRGRTYSFYLATSKKPHFIVKMVYEEPEKAGDRKYAIPCYDGNANFDWQKWGDDALSPQYMWDDGRFTCLKFTNNYEIPVIYQVSKDGIESIVYYHFEEDTMVIHAVSSEFRLRLGNQVLGLISNSVKPRGYNSKATSIDAKRGLKNVR
jgi:type IV secretion system protein VirB9